MHPMCRSKEERHESPMAANDTTLDAGALLFGAASPTVFPSGGPPQLSSLRALVRASSGRNSGANLSTHRASAAGPEAGTTAGTPNSRHIVEDGTTKGSSCRAARKSLRCALRPKRGRKDPLGASRCHQGSPRATLPAAEEAAAAAGAVSIAERQDHHSPATGRTLLFSFSVLSGRGGELPSPSTLSPSLSLSAVIANGVGRPPQENRGGSHGPGARTVRVW